MARSWPRLVLAAAIASAFAVAPLGLNALAQSATKASKKKTKQPEATDEAQAQTPAKKKQDPAEAQKHIEAAHKLLEAGKADAAVQSLTAVLSAGNLPPGLMARALLYRGIGNRQLQKPAQAISDFTSALWLKGGLTEADRADALKQRSAAYAEAGLSDSAVAAVPRNGTVRTASAGDLTTGSNSPAAPSSGGGWNIFGNLFGSGPSASPAPEQPAAPPPPQRTASIAPAPTSSWSSATEVKSTQVAAPVSPPQAAAPMHQPAVAPPPRAAVPDGKFRVQLALVRSESEAGAIAARVRSDLASVFGPRDASVDETVVGNMGTMYRVRVGPYASAVEGHAVCTKLKGTGLDCLVVTH